MENDIDVFHAVSWVKATVRDGSIAADRREDSSQVLDGPVVFSFSNDTHFTAIEILR